MKTSAKSYRATLGLAALLPVSCLFCSSAALSAPLQKRSSPPPDQQTAALSHEVILFLEEGTTTADVEARHGLVFKQTLKSDPHAHVFVSPVAALEPSTLHALASDPVVRNAYSNLRTHKIKHTFVPDDPYFHKETPLGWTGRGQWHLKNENTSIDANVSEAWSNDVTGAGVTIGIVDDGLETTHDDLSPAYVASNSWDFGDDDADPNPFWSDDNHGTSVSGVAGARGGNGSGVVGAAPYASLAGLRIDYSNQTTVMFVDATLYHSNGPTNAVHVKNHSYGVSWPYIAAAAERAALATSTASGTMHVFSAGNERNGGLYDDPDSNRKEPQNSPDSITVAALGFDGAYSDYSCFGANIVATLPSSDIYSTDAITTVDRTGAPGYNPDPAWGDTFPDTDYTSTFGGTSSSAPLMSGILALGKQAQPELNTRFAKHLLARTCVMVDPTDSTDESDGGWRTNPACYAFNQNYGFGLVDASAFVNAATQYTGVTALLIESTPTVSVGETIPDNKTSGVTRTFSITNTTPLEEMLVTLNVTHDYNTDVEVHLTAPDGHRSRLTKQYVTSGAGYDIDWTFCSHAFWGCNPQGTWTLNVSDRAKFLAGTWNSFSATARMGELISVAPVFREVSATPGGTVLQWESLPDREYAVHYTPALTGAFSTVASNLSATAPMNTYTDTVHAATQGFWRIVVEP